MVVLLVRLGWYRCIEMKMGAMLVGKGEVTAQEVCVRLIRFLGGVCRIGRIERLLRGSERYGSWTGWGGIRGGCV